MPEILVKKFDTSTPRFDSVEAEGKYERDLRIQAVDKKADRAIYNAMKDRVIKAGARTDWDLSSMRRYRENYEQIDWGK